METNHRTIGVFTELERRLIELDPKISFGLKRDRWVIGILVFGTALTVPSMLRLAEGWVPLVSTAGVVLELCALGILVYRQAKDLAPDFIDAKQKFALDLDDYYLRREGVMAWLCALPSIDLERRRAYIESRLDSMNNRYAILFGAVDKLGMLPLMAGIFVQINALEKISALTLIFGGGIVVFYAMALWMTRFRLQMQTYIRFLRAAEQRAEAGRLG